MIDASLDIPRRLNDPPRMFWWDIDVALLVLGAALAGMVAGFFVSGIPDALDGSSNAGEGRADTGLAMMLGGSVVAAIGVPILVTNARADVDRAPFEPAPRMTGFRSTFVF